MKVLLTGANGFVGSHVLDRLRQQGIDTAVLLRPTSDKVFLTHHLPGLDVRLGSIDDPNSLLHANHGITDVIHCAGCTKALYPADFYTTNHLGTRNLVDAINDQAGGVQRLLHVSSLAASGPATAAKPASEEDSPHPISAYGKSKLAGEEEVRNRCRAPFTIIRPPAVYGPRDASFLSLFRAVRNHLAPKLSEKQSLSLVYVKDLAQAIVACLLSPATVGKTYFVASTQVVTGRALGQEIAKQMKRWTITCPTPAFVLWLACLVQQLLSRLTRRASVMSLDKFAELRAPGWVCDPSRMQREIGFVCPTGLSKGVAETLEWYTGEHWL